MAIRLGSEAAAQTFTGNQTTSGPFASGTQLFYDTSALNASTANAVSGGFQGFNDASALNASAANALSGGTQYFYITSTLNASAANAVSGGTQFFIDTGTLNASAANAVSGGTQNFYNTGVLNASVANAVSGGTQNFGDTNALNASAANAVSGGVQFFYDTSSLNASVANAVSGGEQNFNNTSTLNASAVNAVSGGAQYFYATSTLNVLANNALTKGVTVNFDNQYGDVGGTLRLNGYSTVVGAVQSLSAGSGIIENGGAADSILTIDGSIAGNSSFSGLIRDGGAGRMGLTLASGALTLSAMNTYTGPTTINGGTLAITLTGGITSNVTNNARFENAGTVAGSVTNHAGATFTQTGGSVSGGVTNAGTVNANGGALNGAIVNNADGIFNVTGVITGNSTFANASGATLAVAATGDYTLAGQLTNSGLVTVADGGALTANGGITNNGTLTIRNGGKVSNWNGNIGLNGGTAGTVTVDGSGTTWTNSGDIIVGNSGAGTMTIRNGGTVSSTFGFIGSNTGSTGTVTVDGSSSTWTNSSALAVGYSGTAHLTIQNGGKVSNTFGVIGVTPSATGTATVDGSNSTWTNSDILYVGYSGTGTLTVRNGGSASAPGVTIAAAAGSTGTLNIGAGIGDPAAAPGTLNTPTVAFGAGADQIVFNHTASDYMFAPVMSGAGAVLVEAGTTVLTATSDAFTGPTTVDGGKLVVNGSIAASPVTVNNSGTLGGNGTVGGLVVNVGGTVAPGNSIGTLNVIGTVIFNAGSIYQVEVNAAGQSDRINATGIATINGGTVQVFNAPGTYTLGMRYTILTAAGGRSGLFDGLTQSSPLSTPFLSFGLSYDPNNAYLDISRSAVAFASAGQTRNQIATGGGLDTVSLSSPLVNALVQRDMPTARHAFDQLSGEVHASAKTALIEDSRFVREAASDRLRSAFDAVGAARTPVMSYASGGPEYVPATTDRFALWGRVFGSWGHTNGDGNAARLNRSTGGFFVGGDTLAFDTWRLGLLAGYSRTNLSVRDRSSSGASDNYHLGLYGGTQWGNLAFRTGATYTWHDISTSRSVVFPGFSDSLKGRYNAATAQAFGELAYGIHAGNVGFEPFANLAYVSIHTDSFRETGKAAALSSNASATGTAFTTLGLRASTTFNLGGIDATVRGTFGWRHALGDVTPLSTMAFSGSSAFTIAGVPIARDAAVVEAGLDFAIAPKATLGISYNGQFGSRVSDQSIRGTFNWKF